VPTDRIVYLKATWTSDSSVSATLPIYLYYLEITSVPEYAKIGVGTYQYQATVTAPASVPAPSIAWSVNATDSEPGTIDNAGLYTPPAQKTTGTSWVDIIEAKILSGDASFTKNHTLNLYPNVLITPTSPASVEVGTGKTVALQAVAQNVPAAVANNFVWSLESQGVAGEALTPTTTNSTLQTATYTAPTRVPADRVRTLTVYWYANNDPLQTITPTRSTINLYSGEGTNLAISRAAATSGVYSYIIQGFNTNRRIYSICSASTCSSEYVLTSNYPQTVTGVTCGSHSVVGTTPASDTCNPDTTSCSLTTSLLYVAAASACSTPQTLYVRTSADQREMESTITVMTTGSSGGCTGCTGPKPPACCGDTTNRVVGGTLPGDGGAL
jgi:hypothetical protein